MWTLVLLALAWPTHLHAGQRSAGSTGVSEVNNKTNVHLVRLDLRGQPYPRHHTFRRRGQSTWYTRTRYRLQTLNRTWTLDLQPTRIPSSLDQRGSEISTRLHSPVHHGGCHYRGRVLGEALSSVAVNLCGGMTGDIRTSTGDYVIYPVESSASAKYQTHELSPLESFDSERKWKPLTGNKIEFCDIQENFEQMKHSRRKGNLGVEGEKTYNSSRSLTRYKRSESRELHLEVLVVADSKMARYHGENLEHYILTLMSTVALIYKDPSIGNNINVAVVDIVVLNETSDYEVIHPIAPTTLRKFCNWQHKHNRHDDRDPLHYDTAILITREDLCRFPGACDTLGLAQSGMVCDSYSSCAIVEDNGLSAAFTIAHELGHVMSIPHDDDRKCSKYRDEKQMLHVMARMLDYNSHPWSWSHCSRQYLTSFIDFGYGSCLMDLPGRNKLLKTEEFKLPPGHLYPSDRQCELVFGPKARICPFMPKCKRLWCTIEDTAHGGCRTQHMPWADGTLCGSSKRCYQGECTNVKHVALVPIDGRWGEWKQFGKCSRTCGGGIQQAFRECDSPKPNNGGHYCTGYRVKYKSCNTQDCPSGGGLFREEQCSEFNGRRLHFSGLPSSIRWIPQYDGIATSERCKLHCRAVGSTQYFVLREKVIDGTPCEPAGFDICVNGNCEAAGCDHVLGSTKKLDRCGVCGGSNNTCKEISGHFNSKPDYGYHDVVMIPPGASNIFIKQVSLDDKIDDNYIALKDINDNYFLNGRFMIMLFPKTLVYYGINVDYSGSDSVVEFVNSTKPLEKDLYVQVLIVGKLTPPNITYGYTVPLTDEELYSWESSSKWTVCSKICNGKRYKKPECVRVSDLLVVNDGHCTKSRRPRVEAETCNEHCDLKWKEVSKTGCSVVCGRGIQHRIVKCMKENRTTGSAFAVPEELCMHLGPKPNLQEECRGTCLNANWKYGQWSKCTVSCGHGIQTRKAICKNRENATEPDSHCDPGTKETERVCDLIPCPQWAVDNWTECSTTCDAGVRGRLFWCNYGGKSVSPRYCDQQTIPVHKEACQLRPCARWETSDWSSCSSTCGDGTNKRSLHCVSLSSGDSTDEAHCAHLGRPEITKTCNAGQCPLSSEPDIRGEKRPPLTRDRMRTSRLMEDENEEHEKAGVWKPDDWSECSVTCGGGVRNRSVSCRNPYDNAMISFSFCDPVDEPKRTETCMSQPCAQWITGGWSECACELGSRKRSVTCALPEGKSADPHFCSHTEKPSVDEQCLCDEEPHTVHYHHRHPHHWKIGMWSHCSASCDGGIKRRQVACYGPEGEGSEKCDPLQKPVETSECNNIPCPRWLTEPWNEEQCGGVCDTGKVRTRTVSCVNEQSQNVDDESCDIYQKPTEEEQCMDDACTAVEDYKWLKGPWSPCSELCGEGTEQRTVVCIDGNNRHTDNTNCPQPMPKNVQNCLVVNCSLWQWSDWSECSATCGNGSQIRYPRCEFAMDSIASDCGSEPPPEKRFCLLKSCPHYRWITGRWLPCNASCGPSYKERDVICVNQKNLRVSHKHCALLLKPLHQKMCTLSQCHYTWKAGEWSECSMSCDKGIQKRSVTCHLVNAYGWVDPQPLLDAKSPNHWCDIREQPRKYRSCSLGHCSRGFVWRPGDWLACNGRCNKSRQKRKLQCFDHNNKKVKNRNCDSKLKPRRKRHCILPSCQIGSCYDLQKWKNYHSDGNYNIFVRGKQIEVYCHGMNSSNPKDFLNLDNDNYAEIYSNSSNWSQSEICPGDFVPVCDCQRNDYGLTKFNKIALNTTTLQIITNDFTFSHTFYGHEVEYASSGDCYQNPSCLRGRFSVSLLGTGLKISSYTSWSSHTGLVESTVQRTAGAQVSHGKCGGHCGTCRPDSKYGLLLDVVPP